MKRPVLKVTLFVTSLGLALVITNLLSGIQLFPNIPASRLFSKAEYNWAQNCMSGEFEIQRDIPSLTSVPRRADLTRYDRSADSFFEPPFGPKPDNVKCFAEFALDESNQNFFDTYDKLPDGSASVELLGNEFDYSIHVSPLAIEFYLRPKNEQIGVITSWQDSILDGRVDGMAQHRFVDNQSGKFVDTEQTGEIDKRSADGTYKYHLRTIMRGLSLPYRD